jgi:hypothetical protein
MWLAGWLAGWLLAGNYDFNDALVWMEPATIHLVLINIAIQHALGMPSSHWLAARAQHGCAAWLADAVVARSAGPWDDEYYGFSWCGQGKRQIDAI